jgi:hypothetical protein
MQSLGLEVRADLHVDENFRDHDAARMVARLKNVRTIKEMSHAWARQVSARGGRWGVRRSDRSAHHWSIGSGGRRADWAIWICKAY